MDSNAVAAPRLERLPDVEQRTGWKKSKIYAAIKVGTFPAPVKIGRVTAFVGAEVDAWIAARIAERDAQHRA